MTDATTTTEDNGLAYLARMAGWAVLLRHIFNADHGGEP